MDMDPARHQATDTETAGVIARPLFPCPGRFSARSRLRSRAALTVPASVPRNGASWTRLLSRHHFARGSASSIRGQHCASVSEFMHCRLAGNQARAR
jgi:hypothetical protein